MTLAVGCAIAAAVIALRCLPGLARAPRLFAAGAIGGLVFQVIHLLEHMLQIAFWAAAPTEKPWLSSWADGTAGGLGYFCSLVAPNGAPSLGVEALHLTGNVIFLGALASWQMARRTSGLDSLRPLTIAERIQIFHVVEHIALVATLLLVGRPLGLSTAFGFAGGISGVALRVWFHFGINAAATGFAIKAARETFAANRGTRFVGALVR